MSTQLDKAARAKRHAEEDAKSARETEEMRQKLSEMIKAIPGHQLLWMIEAARKHFAVGIEKSEIEIIRVERFHKGEKRASYSDKTMAQEAQETIDKYKPLVEFLDLLHKYCNKIDMEASAKLIVAAVIAARHENKSKS